MAKKQSNVLIKWKDGARIGVNAADAYDFFEMVRKNCNGELDIDYAVNASKKKSSPFYDVLEWDDTKAGHEFRKVQMKFYVRKIEVVRQEVSGAYRAYESIKVERSGGNEDKGRSVNVFLKTEDILADPVGRERLLSQAVRDALAFKKRYKVLSELSKEIAVIIDTIDSQLEAMM